MKDYLETTKSFSSTSERKDNKNRQYKKLTQIVKKDLVELIVRQNFSIRKAARQLNINYSSAKIILSKYRHKQRMSFVPETKLLKQANIKETGYSNAFSAPIVLVSLLGGRYQSQSSEIKKLREPCYI